MNKGKVTFTKTELLKEHKRLVKVLEGGSKEERLKEANLQSKEMKKYINKKQEIHEKKERKKTERREDKKEKKAKRK